MSGAGANFVLRNMNKIKESELAKVEIMLIDTAQDSGKLWLRSEKVARMPRLKLIQSFRAGVDTIDFEQLPKNVRICGNVGAYSEPIAEHTMGMILYLAKDLGVRNSQLERGVADYHNSLLLKGKTVGVVGAGGIGQALAKLAKCFGMKTFGMNTSGKAVRHFDQTFGIGKLDNVLRASDVVVLSLPLTAKSFHIIDKEKLQLMKRNCILVNVARGYLIDEEALYYHLTNNPEFKSGLDVWWHYPEADHEFFQRFPFLELPNFVGTPHVSGFVPEETEAALDSAVDNVLRFVKNRKLRGLVAREDYKGLRQMIEGLRQAKEG